MIRDEEKILETKKLLNTISKETRVDGESWKNFLDTSSNLYKYSFAEQLMIYAQNPNAETCATMDFWKDNLNRYVSENTNAVALLKKDEEEKPYIEYVFDFKDTKDTEISQVPKLWKLQDDMKDFVVEFLQSKFGTVSNDNFVDNLLELTEKIVEVNIDYYLEELNNNLDGGLNYITSDDFKDTILASTQYTVLVRCGIDPNLHIDNDRFNNITDIPNNKFFSSFGLAVQNMSKDMLITIGKLCNKLETEFEKNNQIEEKKLAKEELISYNSDSDVDINDFIDIEQKGVNENENNLPEDRRLQFSEHIAGRGNGETSRQSRQMGTNEGEIHQGQEPNNSNDDRGDIVGGHLLYGQSSDRTVRQTNEPAIETTRGERGNETNDTGRTNEISPQSNDTSRGNNQDGINLQRTRVPTILTDEQLNSIISHSINFDKKSNDIVAFFHENFDTQDRQEFLEDLIVTENLTIFQHQVLGFDINDDTISLYVWNGVNKLAETTLTINEFCGFVTNSLIPTLEPIETINLPITPLPSVKDNLTEIHNKYVEENPDTKFDEVSKIVIPVTTRMYSELGEPFVIAVESGFKEDYEVEVFTNENGKEFAIIDFITINDTTSVFNALEIENNNFVKICDINNNDGTINYYVDDLPPIAIERIETEKENYLKSAEMSTEDNYNMIDGIPNNTTPKIEDIDLEQEIISIIDKELFESDKLKRSSKSNTLSDFEYAFVDVVSDTIVDMYTELKERADFQEIQKMLNNLLNTQNDENSKFSQIFDFSKMEQVYNSFKDIEPIFDILENEEVIEEFKNIILDNEDLIRWANTNTLERFSVVYDTKLDEILGDVFYGENPNLKQLAGRLLDDVIVKNDLFSPEIIFNILANDLTHETPYKQLTDEQKNDLLTNPLALQLFEDELLKNDKLILLGSSVDVFLSYFDKEVLNVATNIILTGLNEPNAINNDLLNLSMMLNEDRNLLNQIVSSFQLFEKLEQEYIVKFGEKEVTPTIGDVTVEETEPIMTKEQALEIVANNGEQLWTLDDKFKDDFDVVMQAVTIDNNEIVHKSHSPLVHASEQLKDNEEIVRKAIEETGWALKYASPRLKDDKDIVMLAVADLPRVLGEVSERLQNDPDVVNLILDSNSQYDCFHCIGNELKEQFGYKPLEFTENFKNHFDKSNSKEFAIEQVKENGLELENLPDFQDEKDQENVGQVGTHLNDDENKVVSYVSDRLNKNNSLTPIALTTSFEDFKEQTHTKSYNLLRGMLSTLRGKGLFEATKSLINSYKDDTQKFLIAFNDDKLETLYNSLREPKVIDILANENNFSNRKRTAIDKVLNRTNLEDLADLWKNDKDVVMVACAINGNNLQFATPKIQNDIDVVMVAVNTTPSSIKFASDDIKKMLETNDIEVTNEVTPVVDKLPTINLKEFGGEELEFREPKETPIENSGQVGTVFYDDVNTPTIEDTKVDFTYYSTQRPIGISTFPKDGLIDFENYGDKSFVANINDSAWGELHYSRELTQKELANYDLVKELSQEELLINDIAKQIGEFANSSIKPIVEDFKNGDFEMYQSYLEDKRATDLLATLNEYIQTTIPQETPIENSGQVGTNLDDDVTTITKEKALEMCAEHGYNLKNLQDFQDDKDVVMIACNNFGDAFRYASPKLKEDLDIVRVAVKNYSRAIFDVDERFRDNEIFMKSLAENGLGLVGASDRIKNNKEIALLYLQNGGKLDSVGWDLRKDVDIALQGVKNNGHSLVNVPSELKEKFGKTKIEFIKNITEFLENQKEVEPDEKVEYTLNVDGKQVKNTETTDEMALKILNDVMKEIEPKPTKKIKNDYAHRNFNSFNKQFPEILDEKYTAMTFEKENSALMPLHVELIGTNEISISHTYIQNGDVMRDPEMTFKLDIENQRLIPLTFLNDGMGVHQEVFTDDNKYKPNLLKDLNSFANQWFKNIEQQERKLTLAYDYDGEEVVILDKSIEKEKSKIKSNVVNIDEIINQDEFSSDDIFGFTDEIDNFVQKVTDTRINYQITDVETESKSFSPKEKFQNNVNAIETLKVIESENRLATIDEQEILSKYVGWGGMADVFDENKNNWSSEFKQLKDLLTDSEYEKAKESTLTAFYTPPEVVDIMYKALKKMELPDNVSILDSSAGIGNFLGKAEQSFNNCNLSGTELDSITGRIATQLYQKADIEVNGFEETKHKDKAFDISIGNVPFGNINVNDKPYNNLKFKIHDYFFAKNLDKVRDGGIIALVTSKGTMDKKDSKIREYINERADFLGAIRLPGTTFKANANTTVTSDIIFLQKNENKTNEEIQDSSNWLSLATNDDITMNSYFVDNPNMIIGTMVTESGQYGNIEVCKPDLSSSLKEQLETAINNLSQPNKELLNKKIIFEEEVFDSRKSFEIPENSIINDLPNYSYTLFNDEIVIKENGLLFEPDYSELINKRLKNPEKIKSNIEDVKDRIKALIPIRDKTKELLDLQVNNCSDDVLTKTQNELNTLYDDFVEKYGFIKDKANNVFQNDISYPLLRSLENVKPIVIDTVQNENNEYVDITEDIVTKADIFNNRTISNNAIIDKVENSIDAYGVCLGQLGKIDLEYMQGLLGGEKEIDTIIEDLKGVIFKDPLSDLDNKLDGWKTNDDYLSGNVREKLELAKQISESRPEFLINVTKLEEIQPEPIKAGDIEVPLGATWVDIKYYNQFITETFNIPFWNKDDINIDFNKTLADWEIKGKKELATSPFDVKGEKNVKGLQILEDILNKKMTKVTKIQLNDKGEKVRVFDPQATQTVTRKREDIENAWKTWLFKDPERRKQLTQTYNIMFNSTRNRVFDGSTIRFDEMANGMNLRDYQKNAVARNIWGGNTMLAHEVGTGKTFEMIASAMEGKKIGANNKSMIVVPKHIVQQFGADVMKLYPNAKLLVAGDNDFNTKTRKQFCSKIATNDLDIVIVSQEQFASIPLSQERQDEFFNRELKELDDEINSARMTKKGNSVKKLETARKNLKVKLASIKEKVNKNKDDGITFEQLGIDKLFVDEAHHYKNLQAPTKMDNVTGIDRFVTKSSDMLMKCQYLNEKTNNKGVCFATGTPVTNSISELFTLMRYLQPDLLKEKGLEKFDNWVSAFARVQIRTEVNPTGTGVRDKARFLFNNLPELKNMWEEVTDIQKASDLKLERPDFTIEINSVNATPIQKEFMEELVKRIDAIENHIITDKTVDNQGKIFQEGRMSSLDQRMINPLFNEDENCKINACVDDIFKIYQDTTKETENTPKNATQIVFCDMGVPSTTSKTNENQEEKPKQEIETMWVKNSKFNAYQDIKDKLVAKGVKPDEIAFIHDYPNAVERQKMFDKVNEGKIRVLIGSTTKMGTGTNVQERLIALHHLDTPYRPSDIEQRNGRAIRFGNLNKNVVIKHWVAKGTSESYQLELVQSKAEFISQLMSKKMTMRNAPDIDENSITLAELKTACIGDPLLQEKMKLVAEITKLEYSENSYQNEMEDLYSRVEELPKLINSTEINVSKLESDINLIKSNPMSKENFKMTINDVVYDNPSEVNKAIESLIKNHSVIGSKGIGDYRGFSIELSVFNNLIKLILQNKTYSSIDVEPKANFVQRINNKFKSLPEQLTNLKNKVSSFKTELETSKKSLGQPSPYLPLLQEKQNQLKEIDKAMNERDNPVKEITKEQPKQKHKGYER